MKRFALLLGSTLAFGLVLSTLAPTVALADDANYKSTTKYDFDDDVVEGDLVRPDGEMVDTRKKAKHSSLIKIREEFINEMLKSAEDI
jgi:hypothetical protein